MTGVKAFNAPLFIADKTKVDQQEGWGRKITVSSRPAWGRGEEQCYNSIKYNESMEKYHNIRIKYSFILCNTI